MGRPEEGNANGRKSVPQFGGWEQSATVEPTSYTMVFNNARANRKQNKTDLTEFKRNSLGNEHELMATQGHHDRHHHHSDDSVTRKRTILTYLNCCIKP
uniref:uncharacterized protein LOC105349976 isoform X2 n=1 Tax=Fragaria vesca subsp. vesca TaxID=101020 RepID=UPI0005CA29EB|nr:PREDICTED: uncharacterized protein LOC105349976 isoform X2 [Fragaria vesca subsp. vesca]